MDNISFESKYPNLQDFLQVKDLQEGQKVASFMDHFFSKVYEHIDKGGRVLVLTLTKKSAEDVAQFLLSKGIKAYYLHSEIDTLERWEIIKKLKSGQIDVLVGVNLLREGIDLPEVTFIAILDADKEGFLRSTTALIQNIGRAARNPNSEVVLYADGFTGSMLKALWETYRRRKIQQQFNQKHGIKPKIAVSNIKDLDVVKTDQPVNFDAFKKSKAKKLKKATKKEKEILKKELKKQLDEAISKWEFEKAAMLRDQLLELQ